MKKEPVLSIYLSFKGIDTPSAKQLRTEFHSLVSRNLNWKEKKDLRSEIEKIDNYLREIYDARGKRSVAIFVGKNLFEVVSFEFPLISRLVIFEKPTLEPINKASDLYRKYLVILADRAKARIFTVHMGNIEEHLDIFDPSVPQDVKEPEEKFHGREDKVLRHIQDHLNEHLKRVAEAVEAFAISKNIHFVILGGHESTLGKLKKHLNYPFNKAVLGTFISELNIPLNDVFLKSKEVAQKANRKIAHFEKNREFRRRIR